MEVLSVLAELIPTIGFPIVCVILLGWFIYMWRDYKIKSARNIPSLCGFII